MTNKSILDNWEEEFEKFVETQYNEKFGMSSTNRLNWGCEECGGGSDVDAEDDVKRFISLLLQVEKEKDKQRLLEGVEKMYKLAAPGTSDLSLGYDVALGDVKQLINKIYDK